MPKTWSGGAGASKAKKSKIKEDPKQGSLYSISLQNFMCYNYAEFKPGSKFNVIIGPNGSGKSSIVTAIVVGLGGNLKTLRRQKELRDLVNKDSRENDEATITIKLHQGISDVDGNPLLYTIECKIDRQGHRRYTIDGNRIDQKGIQSLIKECNIQTNNLCQFLPQDVVKEFPQMKPQQVFDSTLKASGSEDLLKIHEELTAKQDHKNGKQIALITKQRTLQDLKTKYEEKRHIKEIIRNKRTLNSQIDLFKKQRISLEGIEIWNQCKSIKRKLEPFKNNVELARNKQKVIQDKVNDFDKQINHLNTEIKKDKDYLNETNTKIQNNEVSQINEEIKKLFVAIKDLEKSKEIRGSLIEDYNQKIQNIESQLSSANEATISLQIEECLNRKRDLEVKNDEFLQKKNAIIYKLEISRKILAKKESEFLELQKADTKRMNLLKKCNEDAFRGVLWLRENKYKENFEKPDQIYEPIMTVIRQVDKKYAIQLENTIGLENLEAFVCVSREDTNKLINCLRKERNLKYINVIQVPEEEEPMKHPTINIPNVNFIFLDETFKDCPQPVKKLLCKKKKLHEIPVFETEPENSKIPPNIYKYFVNHMKFQVHGSKYSSAKSISTDSLENQPSKCFDDNATDNVEAKEIEKRINEEKEKIEMHLKNIQVIENTTSQIFNKINSENELLENFHNDESRIRKLKRDLIDCQGKLYTLQSGLTFQQQKDDLEQTIVSKIQELIPQSDILCQSMKTAMETTYMIEKNSILLKQSEEMKLRLRKPLLEAMANTEELLEEQRDLKEKFDISKGRLGNKMTEAKDEWQSPVRNNPFEFPEVMKQEIERECPKELAEVKARLESMNETLVNFPKITEEDEKVVDNLEQNIASHEKVVKTLMEEIDELQNELEQNQSKLLDGIDDILDKLNRRFRELMEHMGFAGEIALDKGTHELDFKNYGIKILVKWRDSEDLKLLTSSAQSGGEKSVTTALYIMALQEMTQVPFRCVDEINQGMDEQNEEQVWKLLVETAENHSAQFLYMAPKYPSSLKFDKNMHIHTCFNGQFDLNEVDNRIEVDSIIEKLKNRTPQ